MMFDDDDDGVQPEFKAVHEYYFEVAKDEYVCFSILPFQFDENDKVGDCDSEKKVYLRGVMDKSLYPVHKQVIAWRVELECEQPNISVLSSEGNWIKLLDPRKCYKDEIARSILITVQMLHFLRKQHKDKRSLWDRLWDHLNEVFDKLGTKPAIDDLRNHHPLIKLFQERDPAFMKLKILHRFIGGITKTTKEPRASVTELHFTSSDETDERNNDTDSDCGDDGNNDHSDYSDGNSDGDTNNDDGTDMLCAFCDDGGKLLSCIGPCKRSFHPRKEDGLESKCKTLGYTSAQLKGIDSYLCKNCEYMEHQCSKCGELGPSAEPNAKVFKCNNQTCGHFYHPKCVAKLLEPDDSVGSCELAKRIRTGMSFTCPVHWCFECSRMEERTQGAMQFAVCRRCPKSYHRECLPREISFETEDKDMKQRAWKLSGIIIIYCLDHKICKPTGTAERGHIKFPHTPKITEVGRLAKKKGKMADKWKRSIDQCSKKSPKVLNRLPREKIEQTQNSLEHMFLEPECSTMNLKEDLQIEPSSAVDSKTKKRKTRGRKKERSASTSCNIAKKCADLSVQDNLMDNPPADKDAELDNEICRIPEDKDGNGKEKSSTEDATNKATSNDNNEPNGVLGKNFVDMHVEADQSEFKSRAERSMELGKNADGRDSILGQEISMGENQMCCNLSEQELRSGKRKNASNKSAKFCLSNGVVTPDHDDDNPPEMLLHGSHVDMMTIIDRQNTPPEYGHDKGREVNASHTFQKEPNNEQNHVLDKIFVDIHAEVDHSKFNSTAERSMELGENADGDEPVSGQGISMGENQMCRSLCEPEYGCGKDQEANAGHAFQEEPNSSRCDANRKVMAIDASGDRSGKRRKLKEKAADGNKANLDKKRCNHIEDNGASGSRCHDKLGSGNEKNASNGSAKSGLGDVVVTPDLVDDNPHEKLRHVPHVDKIPITDRKHTRPEYGCDKDQEANASHALQEEPNSSRCDANRKMMAIDASGDRSGKRRKLKEKAADGNKANLDKKRCDHIEDNGASGSRCHDKLGSGNEKNASNESAKSGLGDSVVTPDHVDDNPPEKLRHVPHVDKIPITDRKHTRPEYGCDKDQEANASHALQEEPNSSRCDANRKMMAIDASGDRSAKRRKLKEKAADGNKTNLDNRTNLDNGASGSRCHDKNCGAEVSEYKSRRQSPGSNRREILTHITRENSPNSKMHRNSREKSRKHSRNRQRTYRDSDMYEQHRATNEQRYERYPSHRNYDRSHDPFRPVYAPSDFDANGSYDPHFHHGNHEHFTSGQHSHYYYPARPEDIDYSRDVNNLPTRQYDDPGNFMHSEHLASGFDPASVPRQVSNNSTYQPRPHASVEGRGAAYGERNIEYGATSNYTLAMGSQRPAAGSVTDRYAPHLERTNNRPRLFSGR